MAGGLRRVGLLAGATLVLAAVFVGAAAGERQRVGAAEAAGASRDERDPAAEIDLERHAQSRGSNNSLAITSRWICEVPS